MKECPLVREFRRNPMAAMEFAENHNRLGPWARLLVWIVGILGGAK